MMPFLLLSYFQSFALKATQENNKYLTDPLSLKSLFIVCVLLLYVSIHSLYSCYI